MTNDKQMLTQEFVFILFLANVTKECPSSKSYIFSSPNLRTREYISEPPKGTCGGGGDIMNRNAYLA